MGLRQDSILIVDFGSQYTKLIARRLREQGFYSHVHSCGNPGAIQKFQCKGIILAGSHRSVNPADEELVAQVISSKQVPLLGICYGMQLLAKIHGGEVSKGGQGEYGAGEVCLEGKSELLPADFKQVWLSHGDEVLKLPAGFKCTARSQDGIIAAFEQPAQAIYGLQFHPEVSHTVKGAEVLSRFAKLCGCANNWVSDNIIQELTEKMRERIALKDRALLALSGGVDSTVMAALAQRVFGPNLLPIFVDNGLLRKNEATQVVESLSALGIQVIKVDAAAEFLAALVGVTDPETKRQTIGKLFVEIFERESAKLGGAEWLVQGTIYPDVIESSADETGVAQVIKSHHNVGGLPQKMQLPLWEPLRFLFKDEVRALGQELGLPAAILGRHPFPGPGLAVRVLGEVKQEYLDLLRAADAIFIAEIRQAGLYEEISQAFCVFLPLRSVGVIGDARAYGYVIALRAVKTADFMTATSCNLPPEFLARVASRIMNQLSSISRVVYDYSSKPPATIEWE